MSNIIAGQHYEVSNNVEEFEWEDQQILAEEIIEHLRKDKKILMWVSAGNINWQGRSGYAVHDLDAEKLWQAIAGVDTEWTLRTVTPIREGKNFGMMCSHHDAPTGGLRSVKFMNAKQAYQRLRELDIDRQEIIERYDNYTYSTTLDKVTNEMIYEAIEYAGADVYEDIVETV